MGIKLQQTKVAFEDRLVRLVLLASFIPTLISVLFIITSAMSIYLKILLIFVLIVLVLSTALAIRQQVVFQLRSSTNLVEAMASGDFSLRANNKGIDGALSDFNILLNGLAEKLAQQSLITREQQILLTKVTDYIDVAIVAVDHNHTIALMNPAAEQLFKRRFEQVQGWPVKTLGLDNIVSKTLNKVGEFEIGDDKRKVFIRSDTYFELGNQQQLIFVTDIHQLLRDEERLAWQRLLRVLSHEINNSLAPIASIGETLSYALKTENDNSQLSEQTRQNLSSGLAVITERAGSLNHFIQDYQQLTHLPLPTKLVFALRPFVHTICQLFNNSKFILAETELNVFADKEQLQQILVNLFKNAEEANQSDPDGLSLIQVNWFINHNMVNIEVLDQGPGVSNVDNLFVPFYTTKKQGSGVGLALSRQIAFNHGGNLTLSNQMSGKGAKATVMLPLATTATK
jgi:two-component system, NtrC family, nitrogen regulation sensor histidine kinase NtrY